ncbi:hypothetical protein C0995_014686 [Termitomyces sp. Mi166|nr:hypothetical protein C0995_014686 [Termitomyces sp. Mi166\
MAPKRNTNTNWDPILLISQTLHYLTLSVLVPPLLAIFAEPTSITYEGGAANIGMIMDWREMAGRPTVRGIHGARGGYSWAWSGGKKIGYGLQEDGWDGRVDPMRGWIIALCWLVACSADIFYLYTLVRRPRLILDFTLTLLLNHLVLTSYYSASIPTSGFFWLIMIAGSILTVTIAEQLCVKREMSEGLSVPPVPVAEDEALEEMELGSLLRRRD